MEEPEEEGSSPPKLRREIRIPVLQIQKLEQLPSNISKQKDLKESSETAEADTPSPGLTSPPQLHPFQAKSLSPDITDMSEDKERNRDISTRPPEPPPPPAALVGLGRRERRCSVNFVAGDSGKKHGEKDKKDPPKRKANSSEEPTRKIIQSIFAKPKPQKPRRSRRGKTKTGPKAKGSSTSNSNANTPSNSSKPVPKTKAQAAPTFLKIKFESASSRRLRREEEEQEALEKEKEVKFKEEIKEDEEEMDDAPPSPEPEVRRSRSLRLRELKEKAELEEVKAEAEEEEDEEDEDPEESDVMIKDEMKEEIDDDDDTSKKSEDEEGSLSDENDREGWKPVRAAMVAAMELVAKKQVTEDMRVERRVRKPNFKPLPPKGRGRRTIFKKMQKPIRSYDETEGPTVVSSMFYNGECFQTGDIVYLLPSNYGQSDSSDDSEDDSEYEIEPDPDRFFQIRGFVRSDIFESCASIMHLRPKLDRLDEPPFPFDPDMFELDYALEEKMVSLAQLKFVLHSPIDLYHGHDLTYNHLIPGSIYARLGTQFFNDEPIDIPNLEEKDKDTDWEAEKKTKIECDEDVEKGSETGDNKEAKDSDKADSQSSTGSTNSVSMDSQNVLINVN